MFLQLSKFDRLNSLKCIINSINNLIITNMNYKRPGQNIAVAVISAIDFSIKNKDLMFIVKITHRHTSDIVDSVLDH